MIPASVEFLGVKISLISREELKEFLIQTIYDKNRFRVVILDEKKLYSCLVHKEYRKLVKSSEIVVTSSQTVAWIVHVITGKHIPVIMPVTVFLDFMRTADEMNYTVFLFGGKKKVALETLKRIRKSFPQARIVGNYRSNIKNQEMEDVLTTIRKSSPQIFFASYSRGIKQEKWITENFHYFQNSVIIGQDNAFNVIAGKKKMPPLWIQKKGWNGFYTFLVQPYNVVRLFRIAVLCAVTVCHKIRVKFGKSPKGAKGQK
jgi:N-acetylglucosaminyldiphosphoundecaprenol N-acetyl-beta-D-mannosaminyltransferase